MGAHPSKNRKPHNHKEKRLPLNSVSTEPYASREININININNHNHMSKVIDGRRYLVNENVIYLLPIDDTEVDRLHLQHYAYRYSYGNNCSAPVDQMLRKGRSRVLDVGCGAATWLLEMATDYPTSIFTGIDISPMFPTEIKPKNVHFIQRNVLEGLPFPDQTFDYVFMRLMYLSFTAEQWENIVRELSRVLKPGGWIELMECVQNLTNMGPLTADYAEKANGVLEDMGIPVNITELIPSFIESVGCYDDLVVERREIPIGSWGGNLSQTYLDNVASVYQALRGSAAIKYNISAEKWDEITDEVKREIDERECAVRSIRFYAQKTDTGKLMSLK